MDIRKEAKRAEKAINEALQEVKKKKSSKKSVQPKPKVTAASEL